MGRQFRPLLILVAAPVAAIGVKKAEAAEAGKYVQGVDSGQDGCLR